MTPNDLTGPQRRLYDSFRATGMTESAALTATAGRNGRPDSSSSFARLTDAFAGLGLSEDAAQLAAIGRGSEHEARQVHAAVDEARESAAVVATVRDLAAEYRRGDRALSESAAAQRACGTVREVFAATEHAARVNALLRTNFPLPLAGTARGGGSKPTLTPRLQEARRQGTGMRVVDAARRPTGEVLSLAEVDRLLGGGTR